MYQKNTFTESEREIVGEARSTFITHFTAPPKEKSVSAVFPPFPPFSPWPVKPVTLLGKCVS